MRTARSVFCWFLWIQSLAELGVGLGFLGELLGLRTGALGPGRHVTFRMATVCLGLLAISLISLTAAWKMRKGHTRWLWAACGANLLAIPMGTLHGIIGFILLSRKSFREWTPTPEQPGVSGDGTSAWTRRLASAVPYFLVVPMLYLSSAWESHAGLPEVSGWVWFGYFLLANLVCTVLHEAGHLVSGLLSEFKLRLFVVGPFHFKIEDGRWRFRFVFVLNELLGFGGLCGMIPAHLRRISTRAIFMTAGGPFASLLVALVATMAFLSSAHAPWRALWPFIEVAMIIGWFQCIGSLIPARTANHYSDGARLLQYRHPGWCSQLLARSMVGLSVQTDLRPRDWNDDLLERAAAFDNGPAERTIFFALLSQMHADRDNEAEAKRYLQKALDLCPNPQLEWAKVYCPAFAMFEASENNNPVAARIWLDAADDKEMADWQLAHAAILHLEGDRGGAQQAWQNALQASRKMPHAGAYNQERDQIEALGKQWFQPELQKAA